MLSVAHNLTVLLLFYSLFQMHSAFLSEINICQYTMYILFEFKRNHSYHFPIDRRYAITICVILFRIFQGVLNLTFYIQ